MVGITRSKVIAIPLELSSSCKVSTSGPPKMEHVVRLLQMVFGDCHQWIGTPIATSNCESWRVILQLCAFPMLNKNQNGYSSDGPPKKGLIRRKKFPVWFTSNSPPAIALLLHPFIQQGNDQTGLQVEGVQVIMTLSWPCGWHATGRGWGSPVDTSESAWE